MFGSILGGIASVLGGLVGGEESSNSKSKTKTKSVTKNSVHLAQMVRQAERAGFNPLTILRAGGLSAFTNTTSITNSKSKSSGSSSSSSPLGQGIANLGGAIGGAIDSGPSAVALNAASAWQGAPAAANNANQAEYDALQAQLQKVQPGALGTQPRVPVSNVVKVSDPALAVQNVEKLPTVVKNPEMVNPLPNGIVMPNNLASADDWETMFGEPGGYVGGVYNAAKTIEANNYGIDGFIKGWTDGAPIRAKVWDAITNRKVGIEMLPANLWDPPAIKAYTAPVVETKPVPDLYKDPFPAWQW